MATRNGGGFIFSTTATWPKTFTAASVQAGDMIFVWAAVTGATTAPTITDDNGSGTYSLIDTALKNTSADALFLFVRDTVAPNTASTILSMNTSGTTGGGMVGEIWRNFVVHAAGPRIIRQTAKLENQASATPAISFAKDCLTANGTIGCIFEGTNPATLTPPTNWTERQDLGYNTPATGIEVVDRVSGFTSTTITWGNTTGAAWCGIIAEVSDTPSNTWRRVNIAQDVGQRVQTGVGW